LRRDRELIEIDEFCGFLHPRHDRVLLSSSPNFEVMTPTTTTLLPFGSGSKPPARSAITPRLRDPCGR
jgi:hypothetical protein